MRYLLAGLLLFLMAAEVFSWDISMGPGLSVKNASVYVLTMLLMFRIAVTRGQKLEAGPIHVCFVILISYAIVTWLTAALIVEYPGYDLIADGILLKSELIDRFIFFLVFFHGTSSKRDAATVLKALLLAALFANVMTVADQRGFIDLGFEQGASGRTKGALGDSNQYAAFIIMYLPGMIAAMMLARGVWRAFWLGAVLVSTVALMMTVSRGGFVGLLVAAVCGAWLYRNRLSLGKLSAWFIAAVFLVALALSALQSTSLIAERVFTQTGSIDLSDASSGRVDIWTAALERMMATPLTFLTGFGWDVYWTMPFRYSPHNHYLSLWFNLGIPGLLSGVGVLASAVWLAKRASDIADAEVRTHLTGFVIGTIAVCTATFFVDLHRPWLYFWAYAGVAMRFAVAARNEATARHAARDPARPHALGARPAPATDPYGWTAGSRPPGALHR